MNSVRQYSQHPPNSQCLLYRRIVELNNLMQYVSFISHSSFTGNLLRIQADSLLSELEVAIQQTSRDLRMMIFPIHQPIARF